MTAGLCARMVLRWCTAGAALLPSCCRPATALLLPSCCCPAETHLRPRPGGGDRTFDVPAGKCGSDISQVWRGVPDPRPEGALYWDSGRTTPKCGGNMRMLREPHIKPHPVVGKCATRTFSSNPSVVKLRSEESSLKRPMLREPHIKGGPARVLARVYISLLMCAHSPMRYWRALCLPATLKRAREM